MQSNLEELSIEELEARARSYQNRLDVEARAAISPAIVVMPDFNRLLDEVELTIKNKKARSNQLSTEF